jgi:16S rRNA (cytosine967-C5)-methyltransferase
MAGQVRRARPRTQIDAARGTAYAALRQVQQQDAYLNLALSGLLSGSSLDERDRAFATELAHGTARMQGLYDAVLDSLVTAGVESLQPEVASSLRLACHQLLSMRVPAHAAVATSVELVREAVGERPVRLVNAVLRKVGERSLDEWIDVVAPDAAADRVGHLAIRHAHPRWVIEEFASVLGELDEVERALAADNAAPSVSLVVRPGLADVAELVAAGSEPGRWSPYAATLRAGDPRAIPAVREGRAGVQDEGSQLVALAVARAEVAGEDGRWLDLCAGPGGKAALLVGLARERGAVVVAAERQPHRAELVRRALRGYPDGFGVVAADGRDAPFDDGMFDRVIVDAPCTGLGALRRRPEARWRRTPEDIASLVSLQGQLLSSALGLVRPGGVVAYVTCSPVLAETRGVVDTVLRRDHVDVVEEPVAPLLPEVADTGDGPSVQLWPHRHGTDAMFISLLRRG